MGVGPTARPARVKVRPYRPGDSRFLQSSMAEAQDYYVRIDPYHRLWQTPGLPIRYANGLLSLIRRRHGFLLVAEVDGRPAGLIAVETVLARRSLAPESHRGRRRAEVLELYVNNGFRRRGIGRALMSEAERRLRILGFNGVQLEVFAPNRPALEFYRKLRYQIRDLRLFKPLQKSGRRNLAR